MNRVAKKSGTAKRELARIVRAAADSANQVVELLLDSTDCNANEVKPCSEWTLLVEACQDAWPVEGGDKSEVVRSTALLLVLRRFLSCYYGANESQCDALANGGDGPRCLTALTSAARASSAIEQVLRSLDQRLPIHLRELLADTGEAADALLPLSLVYEQLLAQFDRHQRSARGVFHTPASVAAWMVRAVYQLADSQFASSDSLRFVDMGCGCGTFLSEAMRQSQLLPHNQRRKVSFLGYEVVPTAYAMANWLLASHGFGSQFELDIRWCNPLLAGESERARILQPNSLPVLIGNPPYANFGRNNRGLWIDRLLRDYKSGLGERKLNLDDDFIKFIRWGHHWIDEAGRGILAVVTSRTYLVALTHRQMRRSLLDSFDRIYILDLLGDQPVKNDSVESDENVFGVRSGVAIGLFVKTGGKSSSCESLYHSLRGSRSSKLAWLQGNFSQEVPWHPTSPQSPAFNLTEHPPACAKQSALYESFWPLTRIFRQSISGVQTKNDSLFVDFDREVLAEKIKVWLEASGSLPGSGKPTFDERFIQPYLLAPFDYRWIYYDRRLLGRARYEVMRHMLQPNVGLVFMRQSTSGGEYDHFLAVDCLVSDRIFYSRHGAPYLAPLWLYGNEAGVETTTANFTDEWLTAIADRNYCQPSVESTFDYLYAVVHQTAYRRRFAAELRRDFPRIPLPATHEQFKNLSVIGRRLRQLHITRYAPEASVDEQVERTERIGGYDVIQRWRKPRTRSSAAYLRAEDEQRIKQVLQETSRLRTELDGMPGRIN